MTSSIQSRLGTAPEEGCKAPAKTVANSPITLSGEQTINTVAVVAGDRVLVNGQVDSSENGIYTASTTAWTYATDWNKANDVIAGMLIPISELTQLYQLDTFSGTYTAGTTEVTFTVIPATATTGITHTRVTDYTLSDFLNITIPTETVINRTTLAAATADTTMRVGYAVNLAERTTENGGGGMWDVIAGTGTANGYDRVAHDTLSLTLLRRPNVSVNIADMSELMTVGNFVNGALYVINGYHSDSVIGGGAFTYDSSMVQTAHNGGDIIAKDAVFPTDWTNSTQVNAWFTAPASGTGCFVRVGRVPLDLSSWGALAGTTYDLTLVESAATTAHLGSEFYLPAGVFVKLTSLTVSTTGLGNTSVGAICGAGMYRTLIDNRSGGPAYFFSSGTGGEFSYALKIRNLSIVDLTTVAGTIGLRIEGNRFCDVQHVLIDGMSSHGIYGKSAVGDFTDNAQIRFRNVQIENCGGYGIYAESDIGAIQYGWNIKQCRIGLNNLGGALFETLTSSTIKNNGFYYNSGFGLRVTKKSGAAQPKLLDIKNNEFDTNDGVQLDIVHGENISVDQAYLVANTGLSQTFTKGIVVGAGVIGCTIEHSYPRIDGSITGISVHEFVAGCTDVVVRDTSYQGYSVLNGDMYDINEPSVVIDDRENRNQFKTGTYTVNVKNSSNTVTSPTSITGHYTVNGNEVTVQFRLLNNIDISGFAGGDFMAISLPFAAKTGTNYGAIGGCIITSDSGTGAPYPIVDSASSLAFFQRAGSAAFMTASELSTGVSDITYYSLTYIKA